MSNSGFSARLSFFFVLITLVPFATAQINMAALAQFKQNQQAELARKLQNQADSGKSNGRKPDHVGAINPMAAPGRPAVIKAHNPVYKSNYSDMRKKNVR